MKFYSSRLVKCLAVFMAFTLCPFVSIRVTNAKTYVSTSDARNVEKDNTTLPCTYVSNATLQTLTLLEWTCRINGTGHVVLRNSYGSIKTGSGCPDMNLTGRVSFVGGTGGNGSASMMIKELRITDSGMFQCRVSVDNPNGGTDQVLANLDVLEMRQVSISEEPVCVTSPESLSMLTAHGQVTGVQNKTEVWWTETSNTNFTVTKTVYNNNNSVRTNVTVHNPKNDTYTFTLHTYHPIAGRPEINSTRPVKCIQVKPTVQGPNGVTTTSLSTDTDTTIIITTKYDGNTTAQGTESTTVDGPEQTIHVPAVTLLVLACVLFIASVVVVVFVVKFFLKCKKENAKRRAARKTIDKRIPSDQTPPKTTESRTNDKPSDVKNGFSPKLWLFVVFAVVAIIIAITFIAVGSVYLHSEGSPAVSVGLGLCIPFLIMDVFFIIGFVKHMIKVDKHQDENRQGTVVANPANTYENITSPSDKSKNYSDKSNLGRNINQNYNGSFNQQKDDKSSYDPNDPLPDYDDPKPDPRDPRIRSNDPKFDPRDPGIRYNYPEPDLRDPRIVYNDPKSDPTDPRIGYNDPNSDPRDPRIGYNDPKSDPRDPRIRSNASNVNLNVGTAL